MPSFKFVASKDQKRYDLIIQANTELEARDKIHKEWYSILSVENIDNLNILGNKFLFTVKKDSEIKNGIIYWEDIFKVYIKLKRDFDYEILSLYSENDKDKSDEEKKEILRKVDEEYYIYTWKKDQKIAEREKKEKDVENKNILEQDFYLKKELEELYKSTDTVIQKIQYFLSNPIFKLSNQQREEIVTMYNSIVSIKNSRNINKLREVNEEALINIWKIELEYLENTKNEEIWKLLKETNVLLKRLWSREQIIEKEKDIWYQIKTFFSAFKKSKSVEEKKENLVWKMDKDSHSYIKTLVLLKKYKEKKQEVNKEIYKNFFPLLKDRERRDSLNLKKAVINQNISILNAKLKWKVFSYTKITKWYKKLEELFLKLLELIWNQINIVLVMICFIFFIVIILNYFWIINLWINTQWISLIIYMIVILFMFFLVKGFLSFIFYIVFFIFLNIFFIVNF